MNPAALLRGDRDQLASADALAHSLKEGDVIQITARVGRVVRSETGHVFAWAVVDDPEGRGGWTEFRVPIESVKRAPPAQHDISEVRDAMEALRRPSGDPSEGPA